MEEFDKIIRTVSTGYNKETQQTTAVKLAEPLGVVVKIDNEKEFKAIFDKPDETDVFKQLLSQKVCKIFQASKKFNDTELVPYKEDGDIIFTLNGLKYGSLYGGYVIVAHYEYSSTVS